MTLNHVHSQDVQISNALQLGQLLRRTVILPKFACNPNTYTPNLYCNLAVKFRKYGIGSLTLDGLDYREHMFLQHPLVPPNIKLGVSAPIDLAVMLRLPPTHTTIDNDRANEIRSLLSPFEGYPVISITGMRGDVYRFDEQLNLILEGMFNYYTQ